MADEPTYFPGAVITYQSNGQPTDTPNSSSIVSNVIPTSGAYLIEQMNRAYNNEPVIQKEDYKFGVIKQSEPENGPASNSAKPATGILGLAQGSEGDKQEVPMITNASLAMAALLAFAIYGHFKR
jgi:hypothetical protein